MRSWALKCFLTGHRCSIPASRDNFFNDVVLPLDVQYPSFATVK